MSRERGQSFWGRKRHEPPTQPEVVREVVKADEQFAHLLANFESHMRLAAAVQCELKAFLEALRRFTGSSMELGTALGNFIALTTDSPALPNNNGGASNNARADGKQRAATLVRQGLGHLDAHVRAKVDAVLMREVFGVWTKYNVLLASVSEKAQGRQERRDCYVRYAVKLDKMRQGGKQGTAAYERNAAKLESAKTHYLALHLQVTDLMTMLCEDSDNAILPVVQTIVDCTARVFSEGQRATVPLAALRSDPESVFNCPMAPPKYARLLQELSIEPDLTQAWKNTLAPRPASAYKVELPHKKRGSFFARRHSVNKTPPLPPFLSRHHPSLVGSAIPDRLSAVGGAASGVGVGSERGPLLGVPAAGEGAGVRSAKAMQAKRARQAEAGRGGGDDGPMLAKASQAQGQAVGAPPLPRQPPPGVASSRPKPAGDDLHQLLVQQLKTRGDAPRLLQSQSLGAGGGGGGQAAAAGRSMVPLGASAAASVPTPMPAAGLEDLDDPEDAEEERREEQAIVAVASEQSLLHQYPPPPKHMQPQGSKGHEEEREEGGEEDEEDEGEEEEEFRQGTGLGVPAAGGRAGGRLPAPGSSAVRLSIVPPSISDRLARFRQMEQHQASAPQRAVPSRGGEGGGGGGQQDRVGTRVTAQFAFDAPGGSDELPFAKGEVLTVVGKHGGWWEAENSAGRRGLVPSNYFAA